MRILGYNIRANNNWAEFGHDFFGGMRIGAHFIGKGVRSLHKGLHAVDTGMKSLEGVPYVGDSVQLITDDPAYKEALDKLDFASDVYSDFGKPIGDVMGAIDRKVFEPHMGHYEWNHPDSSFHPIPPRPSTIRIDRPVAADDPTSVPNPPPVPAAPGVEGAVNYGDGLISPFRPGRMPGTATS